VLARGDSADGGIGKDAGSNGKAHDADGGLHDGPSLQRGLDVHAEETAYQPEAGVVDVTRDDGTGRDGRFQSRDLESVVVSSEDRWGK